MIEYMRSVFISNTIWFCWSYFKKDNEAKNNPEKDDNDQREKVASLTA